MKVISKRIALFFLVSAILASLAVFLEARIKFPPSYLGMMYTVVSVVFSVCMSVACSLNLTRIKKKSIYTSIKNNIFLVRDTSSALFCAVTFSWLVAQVSEIYWLTVFSYCLHVLSLLYFVQNFRILQGINYEIEDKFREYTAKSKNTQIN